MRVCVIGGKGKIGRRYCAILDYLKYPYEIYDLPEAASHPIPDADRYIIAAPTDQHYGLCLQFIEKQRIFLVEKPLSKSQEECERLSAYDKGWMVCNYKFLPQTIDEKEIKEISYDYYNTGSEGIYWDCAQILGLCPEAEIRNESPIWNLKINGEWVNYEDLERSYIYMMGAFLEGDTHKLWDLRFGSHLTALIHARIEAEK